MGSLTALLNAYRKFFVRPLAFIFIFMSIDRGMRCFERRNRVTSKWVIWGHLCLMNLTILVEDDKRVKELSNFLIVECIQTLINTYKSAKKIDSPEFDKAVAVE